MARKKLPTYQKPPVEEVVCCVYFQDLVGLHAPHLGIFWNTVRDRYTRTQSVPAAPPPAAEAMALSPITFAVQVQPEQLGRTWFIGADDVSLIQIQRDRIVFNWRKQSDSTPYPSYRLVIKEFKDIFAKFLSFTKDEKIGDLNITGLELSYINILQFGRDLESIADLDRVFRFVSYNSIENEVFHRLTSVHSYSQFDLGDNRGHLSIRLNTGQRPTDGEPILRFDFTARKIAADIPASSLWPWFDFAHEAIVIGFADVTSPDVQSDVWERTQ